VYRIAYFGLPLVACLLVREGFELTVAVLPPIWAPGRRRLTRALGERVFALEGARGDEPGGALVRRARAAAIDEELLRRAGKPDLIVSWYYSRRLPRAILDAARDGAIGAHPSLLPRHRGPNPFFAAIDQGDVSAGVTVHRLEASYDTGPMLLTESLEIGARDSWQLARALDRPSVRLLMNASRAFRDGKPPQATPQDDALATWAPEPSGALLRVDWTWSTERVLRRIRALSPVPGLALSIGRSELFVTRASAVDEYPKALEAGEAARTPRGIVIRTMDGAILLERAQVEGDDEDRAVFLDGAGIAKATGLKRAAVRAAMPGES
jgi:methionyl-tRNA formyltransferase